MNHLKNKILLLADVISQNGFINDATQIRNVLLKNAYIDSEDNADPDIVGEKMSPAGAASAPIVSDLAQVDLEGFEPLEVDLAEELAPEGALQDANPKSVEEMSDEELPSQVEFSGSVTENFDLCPGAVRAFLYLSELYNRNKESAEPASEGIIKSAIDTVDKLLGIERQVKDSAEDPTKEVASIEQKDNALNLAREAGALGVLAGAMLGEEARPMIERFKFLDDHVKYISDRAPESVV